MTDQTALKLRQIQNPPDITIDGLRLPVKVYAYKGFFVCEWTYHDICLRPQEAEITDAMRLHFQGNTRNEGSHALLGKPTEHLKPQCAFSEDSLPRTLGLIDTWWDARRSPEARYVQ